MKRLFITIFLLAIGAALGVGGFYVAPHLEQYLPFRDKSKDQVKSLLVQLRRACATDAALKGAFIKSAEPAGRMLALRGLVAKNDQIALLTKLTQDALDESPELKKKCDEGIYTDDLRVLVLLDRLPQLQSDFEASREADAQPLKCEVMRTTRLDGITFDEEGKLVVRGVSVRGTSKPDVTTAALVEVLTAKLLEIGIPAEQMPELVVDLKHQSNPAVALQNKLAQDERANGVRVVSAWYDAKGKLHLDGIIANAEQRKLIDEAVDALAKSTPDVAKAAVDVIVRTEIFDEKSHTPALQKKLVEFARQTNKPYLRHVRLTQVAPTLVIRDKNDDEDHPKYAFEVKGRILESAGQIKRTEGELIRWLADELPKMRNPDQTPIVPKLNLVISDNPVYALQERIVQRGLDGAVFADALFDEQGRLELHGRVHQPGDGNRGEIGAAIKELLAAEEPWTIATLKTHEASADAAPIAWSDVLRDCRGKLAGDVGAGRRTRLDRLYFRYDKEQLQLAAEGVFLADVQGETPTAAIGKSIDAVIVSRSGADVSSAAIKTLTNPLAELQNLLTERRDLDGALLTLLRYDPAGKLILDGYLGHAAQKPALAPLLGERLESIPELLKKSADPTWSIDGMKLHPSAKGDWKWTEFLRACQAELATDAPFQRTCLERSYFRYTDAKGSRRLALQAKAIGLVKPGEKLDELALTQKLAALGKRLLPGLAIDLAQIDLKPAVSPIYELQKIAEMNRHDGLLFEEAFYDGDGKLAFAGIRGSDEQLKLLQGMIDKTLVDKAIAPFGVAGFERIRLVPWQALLASARVQFADDASPLLKQTRIDRVYFQHDAAGKKAVVHIQGVCIYHGKTLNSEQSTSALVERLKQHLQGQGIEGFPLQIAGIEAKVNPTLEMQKQAIDAGIDGVVLNVIGFDAKGACYVKLPLMPKGQEANIRKLIDDAAKKHAHLGTIQQR